LFGDDEFLPHVSTLLTVPSIEGSIRFAPQPVMAGDRKQLAVRLRQTVGVEHAALRARPTAD